MKSAAVEVFGHAGEPSPAFRNLLPGNSFQRPSADVIEGFWCSLALLARALLARALFLNLDKFVLKSRF